MSVLPDHEIEALARPSPLSNWIERDTPAPEQPLIEPYDAAQLAPSSYDVRLAPMVKVPHLRRHNPIDLRKVAADDRHDNVSIEEGFLLSPGRCVLGSTVEWVNIPDWLVCRVDGKSSLARKFVQIHSAGFIDPGYRGNVTLEIVNFGPEGVVLWPDVLIAQLEFVMLTSRARQPYRGRYQDSSGPVASRWGQTTAVPPGLTPV